MIGGMTGTADGRFRRLEPNDVRLEVIVGKIPLSYLVGRSEPMLVFLDRPKEVISCYSLCC